MPDPVAIQRAYYRRTASQYDAQMQIEHNFSLQFMISMISYLDCHSVLDIGSGTGRTLLKLKEEVTDVRVCGIEPSPELRALAQAKGLTPSEIVDGDAQALKCRDGEFDLVCSFGALHHIPRPSLAIGEMLRVSKRAIFISDSNNFGQGSAPARAVKQIANSLGLWPIIDFIKSRGKGYILSEGDGVSYSYSVFNNYSQIRRACESMYLLNTQDAGVNLYRTAASVALLGVKPRTPG